MHAQIPAPIHILDIPVHPITYKQLLDIIASFIAEGRPRQICTANPEFVMIAQRNADFRRVLQAADLVVPDGVGLLWAARRMGYHLPERVTGSDGIYHMAERAAQAGWRLFFLGAREGVAAAAARKLGARYPGLQVVDCYAGSPADEEYPEIARRISAARPHVLLVAYGAPAQDMWLARHKDELGVPVSIGIGGAFDHVVGVRRRAPAWMIRFNLEWLWRLLTQPWRWRRQLDLPRFVWAVLRSEGGRRR